MPVIPRLGINQVQSAQGPQQRVDTSVNQEAFGLGNARSVAPDIAAFAQKIKNDADQVAAMEAENKLIEYQNKFLYDPKEGMIAKKGKDAFNLQNDLNESFAKTSSELTEGLSNPVQKAMFQKSAASRRADMDSQTMKYVSTQIQQYDDETTSAKVTAEMNNAVNGYQDPELITKSMMRQEQTIVKYAGRHGLSPEVVKGKIDDAYSKTHSSIISRMLTNGDDLAAESYYNANKDGILGTQKEAVEKELMVGTSKGKSQRFTDEAISKGMSEKQALAEAAKTFGDNPKLREVVEGRIKYSYNQEKEFKQQAQEDLFNKASDILLKSGGDVNKVPDSLIAKMDGKTLESFQSHVNAAPITDDGDSFYYLQQMAADPDTRAEFMNHNLTLEKGLNKQHREQLSNMQKSLKNSKTKDAANEELNGILTSNQVIKSAFVNAGFNTKKNSNEFNKFLEKVDQEVRAVKIEKGKKKLNNDEIREIANKWAVNKIIDPGFFSDTKKIAADIEVDDIPVEKKSNLEKTLIKQGKPVTDKNILDLFLKDAKNAKRK